ncbi:MAG: HAD family hydrolase [Balneolia bacterium]|nr:HAD family hydrolase [Balneolia bacterium]
MRACFLDRDGTLNIDHDFVYKPEEWDWIPGVPKALQLLQREGYKLIVVTNQSGVARGRFSLQQVNELHRYAGELLKEWGVEIDAWYIAPWHPDFHENKDPKLLSERKPGTALFERAVKEFGIDLSRSLMVGDKASDVIPAIELGIKPFLVESRFTDDNLKSWASENEVPLYRDLPQIVADTNLITNPEDLKQHSF